MQTRRVAAILGFFFVVALLVGNGLTALDGAPDIGAAAAEYEQWLSASPPGTKFWAGAYIELLGLLAMLSFFVAFWSVLQCAEGEWDWLPTLALAAGVVSVAVKLASGPIAVVAYDRAPENVSGDTAAALIESNGWSFVLTFALDGLFLMAAGAVILISRVLPRWLGWLGIVFGAANVLGPLGGLEGAPTILLFLLWVLLASGWLLLPRRADVAPA